MKKKILKYFAYGLSTIGILAAGASSVGCLVVFMDEPEMPESMLWERKKDDIFIIFLI